MLITSTKAVIPIILSLVLSLVAALIARSPLIALRHPPFLPAQFLLILTPIADLSCPSFSAFIRKVIRREGMCTSTNDLA